MSARTRISVVFGVDRLAQPLLGASAVWDTGERQILLGGRVDAYAYLSPAEVRQVAEAWTALADQLDAESGPSLCPDCGRVSADCGCFVAEEARGSALGADTHLRHARICHCLDESDRCCQPSCDCHDEPEDS